MQTVGKSRRGVQVSLIRLVSPHSDCVPAPDGHDDEDEYHNKSPANAHAENVGSGGIGLDAVAGPIAPALLGRAATSCPNRTALRGCCQRWPDQPRRNARMDPTPLPVDASGANAAADSVGSQIPSGTNRYRGRRFQPELRSVPGGSPAACESQWRRHSSSRRPQAPATAKRAQPRPRIPRQPPVKATPWTAQEEWAVNTPASAVPSPIGALRVRRCLRHPR